MWTLVRDRARGLARALRPRQALVFVTHVEGPRIHAHYERLRRETAALLDCFLCVHEPAPRAAAERRLPADFRLTPEDAARVFPVRFREMREAGREFMRGYTDLTFLPALFDARVRHYRFVWIVEYDADWSGDWGRFFAATMRSRADFLSTTLVPRAESRDWHHWPQFYGPPDLAPAQQMRCFAPVARFSRRYLARYRAAVESGAWHGHSEALLPSIALHAGFTVADIGRAHYRNTPADFGLAPGTFIYRPPVSDAYFHEAPQNFAEPDRLYHPVKPAGT